MKAVVSFFILASTFAVQAVPVEQAMELCRAEQNALKRLLCYDAINTGQSMSDTVVSNVVTTEPNKPKTTSHDKQTQATSDFGLEHRTNKDSVAETLYVTVSSVKYSAHDELLVTFDNGQKWRQQGNDYYRIAVGEKHHISRGIMNSFMLGNDDNNRTIRIQREQ